MHVVQLLEVMSQTPTTAAVGPTHTMAPGQREVKQLNLDHAPHLYPVYMLFPDSSGVSWRRMLHARWKTEAQ